MKKISRRLSPSLFLTFDVEEWTLPEEYNVGSEYSSNTKFARTGCLQLLNLLKKYKIKSTFFVTGYLAEKETDIVKLLVAMGHEVASHAYKNSNLLIYNEKEITHSIMRTDKILSNLVNDRIIGFRAPLFKINKKVISLLVDLGYKYDSSIHPAIVPGRYYNFKSSLCPFFPLLQQNVSVEQKKSLLEIPISVIPILRFPISWWWMRNIGNWIAHIGTNINLLQNRDSILYFHTWEYTSLPCIKGLPRHLTRFCGHSFLKKLENFINVYLNKYRFSTLRELTQNYF